MPHKVGLDTSTLQAATVPYPAFSRCDKSQLRVSSFSNPRKRTVINISNDMSLLSFTFRLSIISIQLLLVSMTSLRTYQPIGSLYATACALALHITSTNYKPASPQSTLREAEIKSRNFPTTFGHSGFLNPAARSRATMSAFSPWDTGPPGYMPPGSSQIFMTGGTSPLWSAATSDFAPSFDEPRRSSHFFYLSRPTLSHTRR